MVTEMTDEATEQSSRCWHCGQRIEQRTGRGRKKTYCTATCRRQAQKARDGRGAGAGTANAHAGRPLARVIAEELLTLASDLLDAEYEGQGVDELLPRAAVVMKEVAYYMGAAARDARRRGTSWEDIARAACVSESTARTRWGESEVMRRLALRSLERQRARQAHTSPTSAVRETEPVVASASRAARQLAQALANLHHASGLSIQEVADSTDLSRSYVSRILSVQRTPSWPVVCQLVEVFGEDPMALRAMWESANGLAAPPQDLVESNARLYAALQGLHLMADRPDAVKICELSGGEIDVATAERILDGGHVPTWEKTGRFVTAIGGCPADIRPLWEAVYTAFLNACDPEPSSRKDGVRFDCQGPQ
ncbi:helix-turn-helix domain-containing protein [Streptomyces sp. NBC_00887]|uniref:helix-turn-helix domain-containing protein n=1 Tax=Streptomyces sp. NBC_00887 TaxID=2975859 RepID=UPI00386F668B|nr:helix-turn-helix domain-containing protein [Streptomyces sp. NBC_00887]WSY36363.1 helix-turn-helix domain-containing protein [Streptomyces sp. NBC_00887]